MAAKKNNQISRLDILEGIVETPHEAIIFVDNQGIIRLINHGYADFLGYEPQELLDRPILDVIPNSKLLEVLKTGQPQYADLWTIQGQQVAVVRLPVEKDGAIIGVLGRSIFRDEMSLALEFAKKIKQLEDQLASYRAELDWELRARYETKDIIGNSERMRQLKQKIYKVCKTNSTVLITGESGTGKELFAHAIHSASPRRNQAFVRVNCTSIPGELLESELFGYEEGAFTGAKRGGKLGKFEIAQGGTIFLDEIGDMDSTMQSKLLRVLQEKEIERVGGTKPIPIDVKVVTATNRSLEDMVRAQQFREDLYYRLNVVLIQVPPLRERKSDIPLLVDKLIQKLNQQLGTKVSRVTKEVTELFQQYDWPGNVRELENFLEQAINLSDQTVLYPSDFPVLEKRLHKQIKKPPLESIKPLKETVWKAEKKAIFKALAFTNHNKKEAARLLGIHRSVLYRKLSKLE